MTDATESQKGKPDAPGGGHGKPSKGIKLEVNYGGRAEKFPVKDGETVQHYRDKVMDAYNVQSGRAELALFKLDNTMLEDGRLMMDPAYRLVDGEKLILRQRNTGGGSC